MKYVDDAKVDSFVVLFFGRLTLKKVHALRMEEADSKTLERWRDSV